MLIATLVAVTSTALAGEVVRWHPEHISSPQFESHAAFDPLTGDLYFVRSSTTVVDWRILQSHCTATGWSEPKDAPLTGDGVDADPYFTPDGKTLYFISARTVDGVKRQDPDIWLVRRQADGTWGKPIHLPEPINSSGSEWFPRPAPDGWLYFGSSRPGGLGKNDIWRGREDAKGHWTVENVGAAINTAADEYEPLLSPDGKRMIIMTHGAYYESTLDNDRWTPRRKLGPEVNANGTEIGAVFSPSGHSLMFARDLKGNESGEFFVWYEHGHEQWPPSCPRQ